MEYTEYIDEQTKDKHLIYCDATQIYKCKYCNFELLHLYIFDHKLRKKSTTYIRNIICLTNEERIIIDIIN